jgi:predicted phosphodiesterase
MQLQQHNLERLWFVPDTHRPYHDERAWQLMMQAAVAFRPQTLTVIGDFGDWYAVSDHIRDPKRKTMLEWEIEDANKGLDELDSLGATRKIFVKGNHEARLTKYLRTRAPALDGIVTVEDKYRLHERAWEVVEYMQHASIGKLYVTHDVGASGKNALWKSMEVFEHSVVTGHTHRLGYIVEGNILGRTKVAASFGWLGDVQQMDYTSRAKAMKEWTLGFGYGFHDTITGFVYLIPVPIVDYTCSVAGMTFTQKPIRRQRR